VTNYIITTLITLHSLRYNTYLEHQIYALTTFTVTRSASPTATVINLVTVT